MSQISALVTGVGTAIFPQGVALTTGLMLLTAILLVWIRGVPAAIRLLAIQGAGLGGLILLVALQEGHAEVALVGVAVLVLKAVAIPSALLRTAAGAKEAADEAFVRPGTGLMAATGLTLLAHVVSEPVVKLIPGSAGRAVPVGLSLVLIGFFVLATRRRPLTQLVGFLVLDNGIAAIAFLTAGGVPLIVEVGVLVEIVLVVLILRVLTLRLHDELGEVDLADLSELRD